MTERIVEPSSPRNARIAGTFYLLTFLTGLPAFFIHGRVGIALGFLAGACYVVVTLLFYDIFKSVSRIVSLLAACVSLVGCAVGPLSAIFHLTVPINPLAFFGCYCLLIGYLIFRSTFLPNTLGVLMAFAGLGWLTFFSSSVASRLQPYNLIPGLVGEGALTVWLLAVGFNDQHRKTRPKHV